MTEQKSYLTKTGFAKIKKQILFLQKLRAAKVNSGSSERAVSEDVDPEYLTFYQELGMIDLRLKKLEDTLKNAVAAKIPKGADKEDIRPGATVVVESRGKKNKFSVTGSYESDPAGGKISIESPVGSALLGRRAGDEIAVPNIGAVFRVLSVSYPVA